MANETKEFTYADVTAHANKKDLYVVIHDKVYDSTTFVDEHPYVFVWAPLLAHDDMSSLS
jgi:hypothetical protein